MTGEEHHSGDLGMWAGRHGCVAPTLVLVSR